MEEFDPIKLLQSNGPRSRYWAVAEYIRSLEHQVHLLEGQIEMLNDALDKDCQIEKARDTLRKYGEIE